MNAICEKGNVGCSKHIICGTVTFAAVLYMSKKFRGNINYVKQMSIMEVREMRFAKKYETFSRENHRTKCMEEYMTREQQIVGELHWQQSLKWRSMENPCSQSVFHPRTPFMRVRACLCTSDTHTYTRAPYTEMCVYT